MRVDGNDPGPCCVSSSRCVLGPSLTPLPVLCSRPRSERDTNACCKSEATVCFSFFFFSVNSVYCMFFPSPTYLTVSVLVCLLTSLLTPSSYYQVYKNVDTLIFIKLRGHRCRSHRYLSKFEPTVNSLFVVCVCE